MLLRMRRVLPYAKNQRVSRVTQRWTQKVMTAQSSGFQDIILNRQMAPMCSCADRKNLQPGWIHATVQHSILQVDTEQIYLRELIIQRNKLSMFRLQLPCKLCMWTDA